MKRHANKTVLLIAMILAIFATSKAQLPDEAEEYMDDRAGYGLTGHFINNDDFIDLVTANEDPMVEGLSWLNDDEDPGNFSRTQDIAGGREAKFGPLAPTSSGERWYLAVPGGSRFRLYKVDLELEQLTTEQWFDDYTLNFVYWGHINGDQIGDVVATEDGATHRVVIYLGFQNGQQEYHLNPFGSNPEPFIPDYDTDQLAMVRMVDYWSDYSRYWNLLAVDGSNTNNLMLFSNKNQTQENAGFNIDPVQTLNAGDPIRDFALGYLNDGQYIDLVFCTNDGNDHYVKTCFNTGNGSFATHFWQSHAFSGEIDQVALGDYNHDWHSDLAVYWDGGRLDVYLNDGAGNFDFDSPEETCYTPDYGIVDVEANELMFVDLGGNHLYSVAMTGLKNETDPGMWIWFNDGPTPYMHPVPGVNFDGVPGGHPTIQWIECEDWTVDKYIVYRALMEDTTRPNNDDFDSLTCVSHPTTEFTDTTVTIHTEEDNYKIWYTVTAMDDADHESIKHDFVTFWGYYEGDSYGEMISLISVAQPAQPHVAISPNPFNPQTVLTYQLPVASQVRLDVYDLSGRLVTELVNGRKDAGVHQVTWDASGMPSGLYFCRIEAGSLRDVIKMMLVK